MKTNRLFLAAALAAAWTIPAFAQQPALDRHFLDPNEYFISRDSMRGVTTWLAVARQTVGPTSTSRGDAQFLVVVGGGGFQVGQTVWTRYFWKTRPAATTEATLGMRVFCSNRSTNGVYRSPVSRDEAMRSGWWSAVVTDVSDAFRGEVRAGAYRANIECLRVEATEPAQVAMGPAVSQNGLDVQFLDTAEYFVAPEELRWQSDWVAVGKLMILPSATSQGQAQFLIVGQGGALQAGQTAWSQYYYRTRPVDVKEITVGMHVFCLNASQNDVYRGPLNRAEALNEGWWATTITDVSNLFRNEVQAGNYRLNPSCLRVIR